MLAVVAPLVVVVVWMYQMGWWDPSERTGDDSLFHLADRLEGTQPEVIVLGNSMVRHGVDPVLLKKELGVAGDVVALTIPGSGAPAAYAMLDNRVFGAGYRPKLVVFVAHPSRMLTRDLPNAEDKQRLLDQLDGDDPVIAAEVYGERGYAPVQRVDQRRNAFRDQLLSSTRDLAITRIWGPTAPDMVARAMANTDINAHRTVIPIVEVRTERQIQQDDPATSLVPHFIELAEAHGAKMVFARIPVAPAGAWSWPEPSLAQRRALIDLLNERGAGWVDPDISLQDTDYKDGVHLGLPGARRYTRALAGALKRIGALDGDLKPAAHPIRPPDITRRGTPTIELPTTSAKGKGCAVGFRHAWAAVSDTWLKQASLGTVSPFRVLENGVPLRGHITSKDCAGTSHARQRAIWAWPNDPDADLSVGLAEEVPLVGPDGEAHWAYPGTSLHFDFHDEGAADVELVVIGLAGSRPWVKVGGQPVRLKRRGFRYLARSRVASLSDVEVGTDAGFALVWALGITKDRQTSWVVGDSFRREARERVLGGKRGVFRVKVEDLAGAVPFAPTKNAQGFDVGVLPARAGVPPRCSPFVVEGAKWRSHEETRVRVVGDLAGATLSRREQRNCGNWRWVYPGDRLTLVADQVPAMLGRASILELDGVIMGSTEDPPPPLSMVVFNGDDIAAALEFTDLPARVELDPLPARPRNLSIDIVSKPGSPWMLVTHVLLVDPVTP